MQIYFEVFDQKAFSGFMFDLKGERDEWMGCVRK